MSFPDKLRRLIGDHRSSQGRVGEAAGVSQTQASKWCLGKNTPDIYQGLAIARLFDVPLDYLADDAQDEPPAPEVTAEEWQVIDMIRALELDQAEIIRRLARPSDPAPAPPSGRVARTIDTGAGRTRRSTA